MNPIQENTSLKSRDTHWEDLSGIPGNLEKKTYELEDEPFEIGELIQQERKRQNLTQAQLALRAGTSKNQISRIEKGDSDTKLSTLMKIVREGLGGRLKISIGGLT